MQPDGSYLRLRPGDLPAVSSQELFYQQAYDRAAERTVQKKQAAAPDKTEEGDTVG